MNERFQKIVLNVESAFLSNLTTELPFINEVHKAGNNCLQFHIDPEPTLEFSLSKALEDLECNCFAIGAALANAVNNLSAKPVCLYTLEIPQGLDPELSLQANSVRGLLVHCTSDDIYRARFDILVGTESSS